MSLVRFRPEAPYADLAHLVERHLAKVEVAGSSPVIRSKKVNIGVSFDACHADLAHLVERHLAKVEVAGSSPVIRSRNGYEKEDFRTRFLATVREFPFPAPYGAIAKR